MGFGGFIMDLKEQYKDKSVLITGGAGAIGSNLMHQLRHICKDVVVVDDLSSGHQYNVGNWGNVIFRQGTICNEKFLESIFKTYKFDIVFHLASNFANQSSVDNPKKDLTTNGMGMLDVLLNAEKNGVKRFVYTSSSCVYGNQAGRLSEDMPNGKLDTPYAITKLLGEHYCKFFYTQYKLPVVILRYFNVYGEGEMPGEYRNVIPNFINTALHERPLTITGTGEETRSFCYVRDIVEGTLVAGVKQEAVGETINLGNPKETKIIELAYKINEITHNAQGIEYIPRRKWDSIQSRKPDISKAKEILGFKPRTPLSKGLANTTRWVRGKMESGLC
jgi:nucleoside-diphosphate-sugar epimerase